MVPVNSLMSMRLAVATGDLQPTVRHGLLHGHAAAVAQLVAGEIELREFGVVQQRVVQRVHGREDRHLVLGQLLDEAGNVARVRDQQIQAADAHAHERADRQRIDVVQRQRADEDRLLVLGFHLQPRLVLQHVGDDVPV